MVLETEPIPFAEWINGASLYWVQVLGLVALAALVFSFFVAMIRNGPARAIELTVTGVGAAIGDLFRASPRRVLALARLAIKEAMHRRVLVAFAVFVVVLLFAGWFLDQSSDDPARLYLSFILTSSSYLVLLLALFLSVFSLPADIHSRTIYTIVTKPVRPSELVLGRILGFTAVGTAMLALTAFVSYFFVVRGLDHTHTISAQRVAEISQDEGGGFRGRTEMANQHRHNFILNADGTGRTDNERGHYHNITKDGDKYTVSSPQGMLVARVPIYGKLAFRDRAGAPVDRGVNVGEEWAYRSYIEGGTLAAAIWDIKGLNAAAFPNGLPIEITIRVFRTHKGNIERGVLGDLVLRNPRTGVESSARNFVSKEFSTDVHVIPLKLNDNQGRPIELFRDLVDDGQVLVQLRCLDGGQYFGMAQPDLYVRARDASFTQNFLKGYIGIWLQMLVLTAAGVMFSTFLNGPVAMLATLATMIGGFFIPFMRDIAEGRMLGGGPVEALYRIVTRMNVTVPLPETFQTTVIKMIDEAFAFVLDKVLALLPNFGQLSDADYVAYGFDVPFDLLLTHVVTALAYLIPVFIAGYLFFRTREVAR